jgi:hypothetical protein
VYIASSVIEHNICVLFLQSVGQRGNEMQGWKIPKDFLTQAKRHSMLVPEISIACDTNQQYSFFILFISWFLGGV